MADLPSRSGVFASLRGLFATGAELLQTRLELLVVEVQEEKERLVDLLAYGAMALIFGAAGLVFLAVLLTVLLWESNRLLVLGIFAALFLTAGVVSLIIARRHARTPSSLFAASLSELARDRASADDGAGEANG